ncbi:MAG TPA: glycine--tRNA ligase subunit beta [Burkholderiales bacterium]|jgi:glycyl-tRNA synthetase beta chain|nr:glycine--tRNA ligase subunit beta [Burkholderiales bacterium]
MNATLLVELVTEELPPKALSVLGDAFGNAIRDGLVRERLTGRGSAMRIFATPRRLAAIISDVSDKAADHEADVPGPSLKVGLDAAGKPTPALAGFAKKNGVTIESLQQRDTPKGKIFVARVRTAGAALDGTLAAIVAEAAKKLPVPKLMRWGSGAAQFVRPVHRLVMLHGARVVPGDVLGLTSGNRTLGHRFMSAGDIVLANADEYEQRLAADGHVIADFAARRAVIERQLQAQARQHAASLGDYGDLLNEVTALVEHPTVYAGTFDSVFLDVPAECLILTMQQHQKYFPLFGADGKLLPQFLIVSNMQVDDPRTIIDGNQRVVRPRLEDARFFFNQDRRTRLEARVPQLGRVVYHRKLGTQLARVERLQLAAGDIARAIHADAAVAERAAWLAKADLLTGMVGEFPELQGVMGRYYALGDGEPAAIADAIEAHYRPRFSGDQLPQGAIACAVALADKLDALVGLFGVGEIPTGEKDPFALRRHALGVIRLLIETPLELDLSELIRIAAAAFPADLITLDANRLREFFRDRLRNHLRESGEDTLHVEAVLAQLGGEIWQAPARLAAVKKFTELPEARDLAAANKRIRNILSKSAPPDGERFSASRLVEDAEKALYSRFTEVDARAESSVAGGRFTEALTSLAALKGPVDDFFDSVMVNADDAALRNNRLNLLLQLDHAMNRVADISRLAA